MLRTVLKGKGSGSASLYVYVWSNPLSEMMLPIIISLLMVSVAASGDTNQFSPLALPYCTLHHEDGETGYNSTLWGRDLLLYHFHHDGHVDSAVTSNATARQGNNDDASNTPPEFKCAFRWNEMALLKLRSKTLDWMKNRQKSFIRFTIPIMGYTSREQSPTTTYKERGLLTWVWVLSKYEYMLHYPLNFIKISASSMGIITMDWALDYNDGTVPVSLGNSSSLGDLSFDIDDDNFEYRSGVGQCEPECIEKHGSCGIGKHEFLTLINNITDSQDYEWGLICLQLPYEDVIGLPNNIIFPDVLYYTLFIKKLIFERPLFAMSRKRHTFQQYHCYERTNLSIIKPKELLEGYFVIPYIAMVLWLYIPLLIHYFPSSSVTQSQTIKTPSDMFPSHKSPNYLGRYLKLVLCYYPPKNSKRFFVIMRRALFLAVIFLSGFRIFLLPCYGMLAIGIATVFMGATLCPSYISKHVTPDTRLSFRNKVIPPYLVRVRSDLKEYQLLAAILQERIYLVIDARFWETVIIKNCFQMFLDYQPSWVAMPSKSVLFKYVLSKFLLFGLGIMLFCSSMVEVIFYYAVPLPYFMKEMTIAIFKTCKYSNQQQPTSKLKKCIATIHTALIISTFLYSLCVLFFWCFVITECSLFTLMGGAMLPSMASHYIIFVGSLLGAMYALVHSLHNDYGRIIQNILSLLTSETRMFNPSHARVQAIELERTEDLTMPSGYTIWIEASSGRRVPLIKHSSIAVFLSRELYDYVVEACHPLRRQVCFIVLQIVAILFYALIVMWVKNVFHLEDQVETIFSLVNVAAIAFVPSLLKFLAYKSYFGQEMDIVLNQKVYFALIDYFNGLN